MLQRLSKISLCIAVAWLVAMGMSIITYYVYWPPRWQLHESAEEFFFIGLLGALYVAAIPLLALGALSLRRAPGSVLSTTVAVAWLLLAFLLRAKSPWVYYGQFPWSLVTRDVVQPLPMSLAVGLAFGLSARRVLGPNYALKRTVRE